MPAFEVPQTLQSVQTRVTLRGALAREDVPDGEAQEALRSDIAHEARKYGRVDIVTVPAIPETAEEGRAGGACWSGDVVVDFGDAVGATRAAEALRGRAFGARALVPVVGA